MNEDCFLIGHQRAKWIQLLQAYNNLNMFVQVS